MWQKAVRRWQGVIELVSSTVCYIYQRKSSGGNSNTNTMKLEDWVSWGHFIQIKPGGFCSGSYLSERAKNSTLSMGTDSSIWHLLPLLYQLSVESHSVNFVPDENLLKEAGKEDIVRSNPAVRTHLPNQNLRCVTVQHIRRFFAEYVPQQLSIA